MHVYVVLLRQLGEPRQLPKIDRIEDAPKSERLEGHWQFGSISGERARSMHLRAFMSAPGTAVIAKLYKPTLKKIEQSYMTYTGFEPDGAGVYMQEWMIFPQEGVPF